MNINLVAKNKRMDIGFSLLEFTSTLYPLITIDCTLFFELLSIAHFLILHRIAMPRFSCIRTEKQKQKGINLREPNREPNVDHRF